MVTIHVKKYNSFSSEYSINYNVSFFLQVSSVLLLVSGEISQVPQ